MRKPEPIPMGNCWLGVGLPPTKEISIIQTYVHVHRTESGRMGKRARFIRIMINDKPVDKTATADWSRETECKNKANAAMYVGKFIVPLVATTLGLLYWVIGMMNKYV